MLLGAERSSRLLGAYEGLVYNGWWDLERSLPPLLALGLALVLRRWCVRCRGGGSGGGRRWRWWCCCGRGGGHASELSHVVVAKAE